MDDMSQVGVVSNAIAARLAEDGMLPQGGIVIVDHATVVRLRVLNEDGSDEILHVHVWSDGIDPDTHYALADRMGEEARRRRGL